MIQIHGYPVALGCIFALAGMGLWHYKRFHRFSAWFFAIAAFLLTVGVIPWSQSLASLIASGTGLTVLIMIDIVTLLGFFYEAILKHMHHRIRTPVIAVVFGTSLLLTIADIHRIGRKAAKSPGETAKAIGKTMNQIQSGHAAHAVTQDHALAVLAVGAAILIIFIIAGHRMESRKKGSASPVAAITSGRPSSPILPGRSRSAAPARRGR